MKTFKQLLKEASRKLTNTGWYIYDPYEMENRLVAKDVINDTIYIGYAKEDKVFDLSTKNDSIRHQWPKTFKQVQNIINKVYPDIIVNRSLEKQIK